MTLQLLYWILMLLWLVGVGYTSFRSKSVEPGNIVLFLLLLCLGWSVYGAPVSDA